MDDTLSLLYVHYVHVHNAICFYDTRALARNFNSIGKWEEKLVKKQPVIKEHLLLTTASSIINREMQALWHAQFTKSHHKKKLHSYIEV